MPTSSSPESFASAALRHILDARRLLDAREGEPPSPDQCWHLAGFGPECARKAALTSPKLYKILGHEVGDDGLLTWLLALEAGAPDEARVSAPVGAWRPDARYDATGTHAEDEALALLGECEADTLRVLARLWIMGTLTGQRC